MTDAIIAPNISDLDYTRLMLCPPPEASDAVKAILRAADSTLEQAETRLTVLRDRIFNLRMVCFRIVAERELWKLEADPEYGVVYKTMGRWLQVLYPKDEGFRYAQEANATQKALPAATLHDLAEMPRCNAVQLAKVSESCQRDPGVIEAAKTATEKQFRAKLNTEHGQHLEASQTLKFTYSAGEASQVLEALDIVGQLAGLSPDDRNGALLAWAIDFIAEHQERQ